MWREIKENALFTIHKHNGKYPDEIWKKSILKAEHSPIRTGRLIIEVYGAPSFVVGHFVRHHVGFTPFVASNRSDRTEYEDGNVPDRNTPQDMRFDSNFQSFIDISRKRFCRCASEETQWVWHMIMESVRAFEPEL